MAKQRNLIKTKTTTQARARFLDITTENEDED